MGELRLRHIQIMRDFYPSLGEKDTTSLLNKSVAIWEKIRSQKII